MTALRSTSILNIITRNYNRLCQKPQSVIRKFHKRSFQMMAEGKNCRIFSGKVDQFNGITITSTEEKCDIQHLPNKLKNSIEVWTKQNRRTIWFKVNIEDSEWVPILAKDGFLFHHAKSNFVMMYKWLPMEETCNVPPFAHTMIGVGAIVVNDEEEILVVSEKHRKVPHFKLPGGFVEPNENLIQAAIREVYEETGIQTVFDSLIGFRHVHNSQFGCSDIYNVFSLKPLNTDIKKCEQEIEICRWMKIEEYLEHPHVHALNGLVVRKYLEYNQDKLKIDCVEGVHQGLKIPFTIFFANKM